MIVSNKQHFQTGKSFRARWKPHEYRGRGKYLGKKKRGVKIKYLIRVKVGEASDR